MEVGDHKKKDTTSSHRLYCFTKCFQNPSLQVNPEDGSQITIGTQQNVKPRGWRAMPYILGNETFERLATYGLQVNFMVYLMRVYHMELVSATNVINIWNGISNFAPLIGAFISDAYFGRFRTIAFASCASFLGMVTVTLTAWIPNLHPPNCRQQNQSAPYGDNCESATPLQLAVFWIGLGLLSIGTGGIRPCSIPFGVDQFDTTTAEGVKGLSSFYNWYYITFTAVGLITFTVVVYIQDSISWVIGFGIPTVLMLCSIILFFIGTRIYVHVKPAGSVFTGLAQVFLAAYKKRRLELPANHQEISDGTFYDPPVQHSAVSSKLPLTNQFRFLNKAAMIEENDLNPDGSYAVGWRLCSIQQIEDVKCLLKIGPVWASGIVSMIAMTQQSTFPVSQAMIMDRHLGHKFQIPAGSIISFALITVVLWLPFYDRILVPALQKITKHEGGISLLQRMGIGIALSILTMVIAGVVERYRRSAAISNPSAPMSVMWLAPQLVVMGLSEAFNLIGQIEFYNREFPDHMKSIGNAILFCSLSASSYFSSIIISIVHKVTRTRDHPDWLTNDLNAGKLDYFYYLTAGMGILNLLYFLFIANRYEYKRAQPIIDGESYHDVELS